MLEDTNSLDGAQLTGGLKNIKQPHNVPVIHPSLNQFQ